MLGDYRIQEEDYEQGDLINSGAYGRVYRAIHKPTGKLVAMKVIIRDPSEDQTDFMKYFLREIEVMRKMTHPATLALRGYRGPSQSDPIIVMDLCPNGSLQTVLSSVWRSMPPPEWTPTCQSCALVGMACALHFMHEQKFIHRDLKLANVLLDEDWRPRVCDFGRARSAGPQMSIMQGTPQTMAPEMLTDEDTYTNKVDVYSFGVCLYMFFRNANQFEGEAQPVRANNTLLRKIAQGRRFIRDQAIPEFHWQLITACWDGNPQARPSFRQIVEIFREDKQYAFQGTDMEELASYEMKVLPKIPRQPIQKFVFGRPETAEPCLDFRDPAPLPKAQAPPPDARPPTTQPEKEDIMMCAVV
jgi:serine/threonine protein kinase